METLQTRISTFEKIHTPEFILSELGIEEPILNIYPYGSQLYGTARPDSDHDYIIVSRGSMLANGAFRNNAISNSDRSIQGILYSRSGFQDAIDNYEIGPLECMFLPETHIVQKKFNFKIRKWREDDLIKKLVQKSSASFYAAKNHWKGEMPETAKRGVFHAIRILMFGKQLVKHGQIVDYSAGNALHKRINTDKKFKPGKYVYRLQEEREKLEKEKENGTR